MDLYHRYLTIATDVLKRKSYYQSILDLFEYDMWQTLPSDGRTFRGDIAAYISEESGKLLRTPEVRDAAVSDHRVTKADREIL